MQAPEKNIDSGKKSNQHPHSSLAHHELNSVSKYLGQISSEVVWRRCNLLRIMISPLRPLSLFLNLRSMCWFKFPNLILHHSAWWIVETLWSKKTLPQTQLRSNNNIPINHHLPVRLPMVISSHIYWGLHLDVTWRTCMILGIKRPNVLLPSQKIRQSVLISQ